MKFKNIQFRFNFNIYKSDLSKRNGYDIFVIWLRIIQSDHKRSTKQYDNNNPYIS